MEGSFCYGVITLSWLIWCGSFNRDIGHADGIRDASNHWTVCIPNSIFGDVHVVRFWENAIKAIAHNIVEVPQELTNHKLCFLIRISCQNCSLDSTLIFPFHFMPIAKAAMIISSSIPSFKTVKQRISVDKITHSSPIKKHMSAPFLLG